ncbi:putative lipoprotein [Leptospira inadai serovar Lyme str. 10]|uniref:Lipoprotein n=2 Tax=Leptospira inadai serovar Lyme TaxID=293084 RepID=A0ABX4YDF8_9LEPT|nr:hypothetical protein [Leptospira inadai]EQA34683.1 putative lipoprotein [Leptospira inadai serovar Lyme str. 10]PNV72267.1 hypothetical protein BES34_019620 [Leptospira inadai serovar Lyme]
MNVEKFVVSFFLIILAGCFDIQNAPTKNSEVELIKCTNSDGIKKYSKGCIPPGKNHFCSMVSESIKKGKLFELMAKFGKWKATYDAAGDYYFLFLKNGQIIQYESLAGDRRNDKRVKRNGSIILTDEEINIKGLLIYKEGKGMVQSNEKTKRIGCYVGAPDQLNIKFVQELAFEPIEEGSLYYEPANIEIDYPSGEMREVK